MAVVDLSTNIFRLLHYDEIFHRSRKIFLFNRIAHQCSNLYRDNYNNNDWYIVLYVLQYTYEMFKIAKYEYR